MPVSKVSKEECDTLLRGRQTSSSSSAPYVIYRRRIVVSLLILLASFGCLTNLSHAQHFAKMDDTMRIQLSLDMIRLGVQHQDTIKLLRVMGEQLELKGIGVEQKTNVVQRMHNAFANSSTRKFTLVKPALVRADNPLHSSNFWDFDIVDPRITIKEDTAFVDCELVLYGAPGEAGGKGRGSRVKERFVFASPRIVEPKTLPEGTQRWPGLSKRRGGVNNAPRSWQWVGYEQLSGFLNKQVKVVAKPEDNAQGEKK